MIVKFFCKMYVISTMTACTMIISTLLMVVRSLDNLLGLPTSLVENQLFHF